MICIFSAARSGSTWIGKIFDSHPDVCYLHEPEIADRGIDLLPFWFEHEPEPAQIEAARAYLTRLGAARTARTTGTRPFFPKSYRSMPAEVLRRALIYAAKGAERIGFREYANAVRIPDLIDRGRPKHMVSKLVAGLGRAEVLIKAADENMQPILLMRHPCGYVDSLLRGMRIGVMGKFPGLGRLLETRAARRLGVHPSEIDASNSVEQLAWNWLLSNAEAYPAVRSAGGEIVIYERLAGNPKSAMAGLFDRLGLGWPEETEAFLKSTAEDHGGYYSVYRDPMQTSDRWRTELGEEAIARVRAIVTRDPIGRAFFEC
jgi:hypothetical protein